MGLAGQFGRSYFAKLTLLGSFVVPAHAGWAAAWERDDGVPTVQVHEEQSPHELTFAERGSVALARREYVSAIAAFEKAEPKDATTLNQLGVAYEHVGLYAKARASFEGAIKLDHKLANAYNNLGTVFYVQHNLKEAERNYKKAIKLNSKSASALQNLGTLYFVRHKFNRGREAYEDAFRLDPEIFTRSALFGLQTVDDKGSLADISFFLAELYASAGKNDLALTYLIKALNHGFKDEARIRNDKELASLREMPGFIALIQTSKEQPQKAN